MLKLKSASVLFAAALAAALSAGCAGAAAAATAEPVSLDEFVVHLNAGDVRKAPSERDDFYLHVNFNWLKTRKIPATDGFCSPIMLLRDQAADRLSALAGNCVKERAKYSDDSDEARIADLRECIADFKGRGKAGLGGLAAPLAAIEKASTLAEFSLLMARLGRDEGFSCLAGGFSVAPDPIKADRYVVYIDEPSLGLGREFLSQPRNEEYFQYYRDYLRDLLTLYGRPKETAAREAQEIFAFQQDLAMHSLPLEDLYNPAKSTHRLDLKELSALYANFDVPAMLKEAGIGPQNGVSSWYMQDPDLVRRFCELYKPERLQFFKDYAVCSMLADNAMLLTKQYADLAYEYDRKMNGAPRLKSASKRADELCQRLLALNYGRLYASRYVSEKTRQDVRSYIALIMDEYRKKLANLAWMDESTKKQALKKLDAMTIRVGYPDKWPSYVDDFKVVKVRRGGSLIDNALTLRSLKWQRLKDRIGKPVDRTEWELPPQTVNAFYRRSDNSINFPAGILQPPFYDPAADRETNLGGIGMVIAHEMTHSFDSNGSQYDETGALRDWWTERDKREFLERQASIVRFYSRYRLQEGVYQDGKRTISENIADLGSISCLTDIVGDDAEGLRRLYVNYAKVWAQLQRDAYVRQMLTDVHSFPYVRVDAVLSSTDGFYKACGVKPGDGMYVKPEERARLW